MRILKLFNSFDDLSRGSVEIANKLRKEGVDNILRHGGLSFENEGNTVQLECLSSPILFESVCGSQFDAIIFPVGEVIGARLSSRLFRREYVQSVEDVLYWAMEGDDYVLGGRTEDWASL